MGFDPWTSQFTTQHYNGDQAVQTREQVVKSKNTSTTPHWHKL